MKGFSVFVMMLCVLVPTNGRARPAPCDCYGGIDLDLTPTYWFLLDHLGNPLENGDWAYAVWTGPDKEIDPPDLHGYPTGDDMMLRQSGNYIEYGMFAITATTWGPEDGEHPWPGDLIYCRIFDGPEGSIGHGSYYADSQLHEVRNVFTETFFCVFPGDPYHGHTEFSVPVKPIFLVAVGRNHEVLLKWRTTFMPGYSGFHIERSLEGFTFQRINQEIVVSSGGSENEGLYSYVDGDLDNEAAYYYNLIAVDMDGVEKVVNEIPLPATPRAQVPTTFQVAQQYPNLLIPATQIKYGIPEATHVSITIDNVRGTSIATLVDAHQEAGSYTVSWDMGNLANGVYICRFKAGDFHETVKMVHLK